MSQVDQVMTRAVASVTPETPVSQVATMMRDLNIGDVLVLEEGKLRGIVTDRDLATKVLTNGAKASSPVKDYMSTNVVTGSPDWSLEQVADVMGKNQVRRLPIVQDDTVLGIVSLGDVALHTPKKETVANSLKNISDVTRGSFRRASPLAKIIAVALPIAVGAAVLVLSNTKQGRQWRQQLQDSDLSDQARAAVASAVKTLQDPRTRQAALDALDSTGIPDRTRQAFNDGVRTLTDPETRARIQASLQR